MVRAGLLSATTLAGLVIFAAHPARAANPTCFWIHGRLSAANGAPTFRIRGAGARRVFGVTGDRLPEIVQRLVQPDAFRVDIIGDYRLCPLAPDHPGRMRPVRLEDARRMVVLPAHPYVAR